ncbi:MAG: AAA family ATPase, partial [Gammaproteobacteria bacterium]|nr:AAA family ATPase [Gammaproteobacteria bacterium]
WMEHHPLPFACTTNFVDRLDPATLRRFDFKMGLDYLSARQAEMAFRSFFELEPPGRIGTLHNLTPGDFALVHRKADVLGALGDRDALFGMLRDECEAKPGCRRQIGFAA